MLNQEKKFVFLQQLMHTAQPTELDSLGFKKLT